MHPRFSFVRMIGHPKPFGRPISRRGDHMFRRLRIGLDLSNNIKTL